MNNINLLEAQRKEAIARIDTLTKAFNLNPHIKDYFMDGKVYYSYITAMVLGSIDTIEYDKRYAKVVKGFENRTHSLVYHAIELGDTLSFCGVPVAISQIQVLPVLYWITTRQVCLAQSRLYLSWRCAMTGNDS